MLSTLRGFLPWIAFAVVSGFADWRAGALVGIVLGAALLVYSRRTKHAWDELVIETSAALFFVALTVVAFVAPQSPLQHYTGGLSLGWLAITAWGSLAVRKPFTLGIARQSTPEQFWTHPAFYRVNVIITSVWSASFTVTAIAAAIVRAEVPNSTAIGIVIQVVGFLAPAYFTIRYRANRRRAAEAAAQAGARA